MKKYRLKKDFPGSKIGDAWVKAENGFMSPEGRETIKMHEHLFEPFNDWFEDYEEPKEHWCINKFGTPEMEGRFNRENIYDKARKLIGNDFETKEETEKAVEKLKAWKRLKDKGFRFTGWEYDDKFALEMPHILIRATKIKGCGDDLDLLFSQEDD